MRSIAKTLPASEGFLADEFTATYDDGSRGDKARELALVTEFDQRVDPQSRTISR